MTWLIVSSSHYFNCKNLTYRECNCTTSVEMGIVFQLTKFLKTNEFFCEKGSPSEKTDDRQTKWIRKMKTNDCFFLTNLKSSQI